MNKQYTVCLVLYVFFLHIAHSSIEVKVLIKRCNEVSTRTPDDSKEKQNDESTVDEDDQFPGIVRRRLDLEQQFEMDEPEYPFHLTRCQRKLAISLWIKNRANAIVNTTDEDEQLIYIDHGYDDVTNKIVKLLSPVTIRFRQLPVLQAYPFRNIHVVNGLVHEEVINKDETPNFKGCDDTSSSHPTCSYAYKKGKPIPYSQGFCCYCTASGRPPAHILAEQVLNNSMQPSLLSVRPVRSGLNDLQSLKGLGRAIFGSEASSHSVSGNAENSEAGLLTRQVRQQESVKGDSVSVAADALQDSLQSPKSPSLSSVVNSAGRASRKRRSPAERRSRRTRRQLTVFSTQRRGGQDCTADTPVGVDPDRYLSSAHCLRLHDIWYNVNAVQVPRLRHSLQLQVYVKRELPDGTQRWSDITSGRIIMLGTDSMHHMEKNQSLVATYSGKVLRRENQAIPSVTDKMLLIPQMPANERTKSEYPQLQGAGEYLVVSRTLVDMSGKSCDKIGATYSTFALQKERCERPRGSCLNNQPIQLWERDKRSGGALRYRLADYGIPHEDAIEVNRASGEYLLLMKHTYPYTSYVDIEVDADDIGILRTGMHAQITNVYTKSGEQLTLVTTVITNTGLVSSAFSVQIASCSHKVPNSKRVAFNLAPQNQVTINITLNHGSEIIRDKIVCSALVRNSEDKMVAARRIHAYPHDRCVCVWFCLCACAAERYSCTPMSLSHYRSSGFLGSIPSLNKSRLPFIAEIVLDVELVLIMLTILGLLLGSLKALAGILFPDSIGLFGLAMCNDKPRKIEHYYESELRHFPVEYDRQGYPVHPLTKTPSVRRMSGSLLFCLNLTWFFYMPLSCWYWVRKSRGCLPAPCARCLCCCPELENSPRSQSVHRSLLAADQDAIPSDMSEYRAQSYGGTGAQDLALDQYRASRDQLRASSNSSLGSSISQTGTRPSANSLSRASLSSPSGTGRRTSSARSLTRTSASSPGPSSASPTRSSGSLTTSASRRLSQTGSSGK